MVMVKIDSCKIDIPLSCIQSNLLDMVSNDTVKGTAGFKGNLPGFKSLVYNLGADRAQLELSAKVLGSDYFAGININSIEQVFDRISDTGAVMLDKNIAIEQGKFLRADITCNVKYQSNQELTTAFDALFTLQNGNYQVQRFSSSKNRGVVFSGKQSTFKERQIFYDKQVELLHKRNKDFLTYSGDKKKLFIEAENVLRVEQNLVQFSRIRSGLNVVNTGLLSVLNSSATPNLKLFQKIRTSGKQCELFNVDGRLSDIEKLYGRMHIIESFDSDISMIKQFIESKVKGDVSRYIRQYKAIIDNMRSESIFAEPNKLRIVLDDLESRIKVA